MWLFYRKWQMAGRRHLNSCIFHCEDASRDTSCRSWAPERSNQNRTAHSLAFLAHWIIHVRRLLVAADARRCSFGRNAANVSVCGRTRAHEKSKWYCQIAQPKQVSAPTKQPTEIREKRGRTEPKKKWSIRNEWMRSLGANVALCRTIATEKEPKKCTRTHTKSLTHTRRSKLYASLLQL